MGNKISSLPADVDSVLQDLAQMVSVKDKEIDYSDIIAFSDKATIEDISEVRELIAELADYDFDFEDPDAEGILLDIFEKVKG